MEEMSCISTLNEQSVREVWYEDLHNTWGKGGNCGLAPGILGMVPWKIPGG